MGWKDGMRFVEWFKRFRGEAENFDSASEDHRALRQMYYQAYKDGFEAGQCYDPKEDAD